MTTNQPTPPMLPPVVSGPPVIPTQAAAPEAQPSYPQPDGYHGPQYIIQNVSPGSLAVGPRKSAWTVFWLDMFFGFLGVHRFYLGHFGLGFLYLFTGGLFGVGAIVDLFIAWHITRKENVRRGYGPVTR